MGDGIMANFELGTMDGRTYAKFETFADAANCAVAFIRQRRDYHAMVRCARTGVLYADFRLYSDGNVSVAAAGQHGTRAVQEWAA